MSLEFLFDVEYLKVAIAAFVLIAVVRSIVPDMPPKKWYSKVGERLLPLLPLLVSFGLCAIPGMFSVPDTNGGHAPTIGDMMFAGLWCGFLAAHGRSLLKKTVIGSDLAEELQEGIKSKFSKK